MKKITIIKHKKIGKLVTSATGLRKMANALQKNYKTKGDVVVDHWIHKWKADGKTKYTLGINVSKKSRRKLSR